MSIQRATKAAPADTTPLIFDRGPAELKNGDVAESCLPAGRGLKRYNYIMFFVYILKSQKDNSIYIGKTNNILRRFNEHASGHVRSTKSKRPLVLLEQFECNTEREALKLEKEYKKGFNREKIRQRNNL